MARVKRTKSKTKVTKSCSTNSCDIRSNANFRANKKTTSDKAKSKKKSSSRSSKSNTPTIYQDIKDLKLSASIGNPQITHFEDSVFTGKYCTSGVTKQFLKNLESERTDDKR